MRKKLLVPLFGTFLFFVVLGPVQAIEISGSNSKLTPRASFRPAFTPRPSGLANGQKISCQAKEDALRHRSESLVKTANSMILKFDAILLGVENYYTGKLVPAGTTVANYQALLIDIQTKKAAVQSALKAASTDAGSFSCSVSDPRGTMLRFIQNMRNVITLLGNYRVSIRNLIVAVHSVSGDKEVGKTSPWPTSSAKPVRSPFATYKPKPSYSPIPYFSPAPGRLRSPGPAIDPFVHQND